MSDEEFDISKLIAAIPANPMFDEGFEQLTPMLSLVATMYAKMLLTNIPPGLAEKLTYQWIRGVFPTIFNTPTVTIILTNTGGV